MIFTRRVLNMLIEKIRNRGSGSVLYGIVPPNKGTDAEKVEEISFRQIQRLKGLSIDGLVIYDIQDEKFRTDKECPFPFMETLNSFLYSRNYLSSLSIPKVIYRSVGKYNKAELSIFLEDSSPNNDLTVFVGTSSKLQDVTMSAIYQYIRHP